MQINYSKNLLNYCDIEMRKEKRENVNEDEK